MKVSKCEQGTLAAPPLFLSKQCGLEEVEKVEGWRSTCVFVQTLTRVMSPLNSKHLSVFHNGDPDPGVISEHRVNDGRPPSEA